MQFAAKALEVWFAFDAASLVYIVATLLARGERGLPLGNLLAYLESLDLLVLLSPSFWGSSKRVQRAHSRQNRPWLFVTFVIAICVLANVMGPSIAILILPSLDYHDSTFVPQQTFKQLLSADPPTQFAQSACTPSELSRFDYSCAYNTSGLLLDALANNNFASLNSWIYTSNDNSTWTPGASTPERGLQFSLNTTLPRNDPSGSLLWTPLRQVIDDLYTIFTDMTDPNSKNGFIAEALNSLELNLRRRAPALGEYSFLDIGNLSTTFVDSDRQIRCYFQETYADCHRVGSGWGQTASSVYSFSVGSTESPETIVTVDIFNSPRRAAFNVSDSILSPSGCLTNGTLRATNCDFDSIFATPWPKEYADLEQHTDPNLHLYIETGVRDGPVPDIRYLLQTTFLLTNVTYSLDVSQDANRNHQVEIVDLPQVDTALQSVAMHPAWFLAAWSAGNGSTVPLNHSIASYLYDSVLGLQRELISSDGFDDDDSQPLLQWWYSLHMASMHAASYVNYSFTPFYNGSSTDMRGQPDPSWETASAQANLTNPIIYSYFHRRVWIYGIESRITGYLGVVVAVIGMLVVVARTVLKLCLRIEDLSLLELVVAALEYESGEDFDGIKRSEWRMGRVRFGLHHDRGEVRFTSKRGLEDSLSPRRERGFEAL